MRALQAHTEQHLVPDLVIKSASEKERKTCLEILFLNHCGERSDDPGTVFGGNMYHWSLPTASTSHFPLAFRAWDPLDESISVNLCANCGTDELRNGDRSLRRRICQKRQEHI